MTQYTACRFTGDAATLREAAARGSLCAQVFLDARHTSPEDNSNKRPEAANHGRPAGAASPGRPASRGGATASEGR